MGGILTVLIQLLPTLLPLILELFKKSREARIKWFDDATKAYLAEKKPVAAFWTGSAACAVKGMSEDEWQVAGRALEGACAAASEFAAIQEAKRAATKGGEV